MSNLRLVRKRPVVVEAFAYDGTNSAEIVVWADTPSVYTVPDGPDKDLRRPDGELLFMRTLQGPLYASVGDWIIRGVHDEFYPCKPDVFDATYESVV